jgi:hypothetical protein
MTILRDVEFKTFMASKNPEDHQGHCILQCIKCNKIFYSKVYVIEGKFCTGQTSFDFKVIETYPKYVPKRHESIPEKIWVDYLEACKAYDVEALKSSVVMCRRTLQNVCLERGAIKVDANGRFIKLKEQINQAFPQKDYDLINAIGDAIKYFGDYGAHPQDDNIDDITKESAKKILSLTNEVLKIGYIIPWELRNISKTKNQQDYSI